MRLMCDGHNSNGVISILILDNQGNTSGYEYKVDAARIPNWRERIVHLPNQHCVVLKEIKKNATWYRKVR